MKIKFPTINIKRVFPWIPLIGLLSLQDEDLYDFIMDNYIILFFFWQIIGGTLALVLPIILLAS
jgi:hypothetical protein